MLDAGFHHISGVRSRESRLSRNREKSFSWLPVCELAVVAGNRIHVAYLYFKGTDKWLSILQQRS